MRSVPEPIDILAPFLALVTGCDELDNLDDMCGAISSMSMTVDFRKMFKVPAAVRSSIKFSLSVREEYRVQWDRFFLETPTLEQVYSAQPPVPAVSRPLTPDESVAIVEEDGEAVEVTYTGESYDMDDLMSRLDAISGESEEDEEPEEEEEVKPKAKSGFAMLRGMK